MPYYTTATTATTATKCNRHRLLWMMALVFLVFSATPAFAFAPAAYSNVAAAARVMAGRPISSTSSSSTRIFAASTTSTSRSPFTLPEGVIKTISKPGNGEPITLGDIATVKYTCYLPGDDSSVAPFAKAEKQKLVRHLGSFLICCGCCVCGYEGLQTLECVVFRVLGQQPTNNDNNTVCVSHSFMISFLLLYSSFMNR
jgi:hypothetical protein